MIKLVVIAFLTLLTSESLSFANTNTELAAAMADAYPQGGWAVVEDKIISPLLTAEQIDAVVSDFSSLAKSKTRAIKKIRKQGRQALQDSTGYALGNATTRSDFIAAIRSAYLAAKNQINNCADIACVKAVTPVFPADPGE